MDSSRFLLCDGSIQAQSFPVRSTFLAGLISCNKYIRQIYIRFFVYTICFTTSEGTIDKCTVPVACYSHDESIANCQFHECALPPNTRIWLLEYVFKMILMVGIKNLCCIKKPQSYITSASQNTLKLHTISITNTFFPEDSDRDCNYKLYLVQS